MGIKILKFIGLIAGLYMVYVYVPFGDVVGACVIGYGLWKVVND